MIQGAPNGRGLWYTAIVILMAGNSVRMGCIKALVHVRGRPLLAHVLEAAHSCAAEQTVLVLGADHVQVCAAVDTGTADVVVNDKPQLGIASSLATAMRALKPCINRVVVLLGDQPNVDAGLVRQILDLQHNTGRVAAAVRSAGVTMPPVVITGSFLEVATQAHGDVGLRSVLRAHPDLVAVLDVDPIAVMDVDAPSDLTAVEMLDG